MDLSSNIWAELYMEAFISQIMYQQMKMDSVRMYWNW